MAMELKASPQGPIRIFTTRNGRKVELIAVLPECRAVYGGRIIGLLAAAGKADRGVLWWRMNGRYIEIGEHDWDLMDLPAEGLEPTVPPVLVGPRRNIGTDVVSTCEEIIRGAQDMIARARLTMRPFEKPRVVMTREEYRVHVAPGGAGSPAGGRVPEQSYGCDLGGTEHLSGQRSAVAESSSLGPSGGEPGCGEGGSVVWKPAGDRTDWGREPPLTERAARHQLLDEIVTPVILVLQKIGRGHATENPIGWLEAAIVVRALREAGYGNPKEATAAGPPAK